MIDVVGGVIKTGWDWGLLVPSHHARPASFEVSALNKRRRGEGLVGSCVVYIPAMQNNQGSDEREESLLIRSSDGHIFSIFYDHVVQENGGEADRVRVASKLEISAPGVSEALHWPRERQRHFPGGGGRGGGEVGLHWCLGPFAPITTWRTRTHACTYTAGHCSRKGSCTWHQACP